MVNGRKKVLVDLTNIATPQIAGVGVFTKNLLSLWFSINDLKYEVVCYHIHGVDPFKIFSIPVDTKVRFRSLQLNHVFARFTYQQFVLPFKLIGFALYYNPAMGFPFFAKLISPKTNLVLTIHDMTPFYFPKKYKKWRSLIIKLISKYYARFANHIITVSLNSKRDIILFTNVSPSKITIVYNFFTYPSELDNAIDKNYFLCISTIEPGKNFENTVEGFCQFLLDYELPYKFYWIGRLGWGYKQEDITSIIIQKGAQEKFLMLGYLEENEKRKFIRECSAIVYLSFYEGFGLPVLEGMLLNKPAVVSNNSSLPEIVGSAGILCNPSNPKEISKDLLAVLKNCAYLKGNIPNELKKFNPSEQLATFLKVINNLL